MIKRSTAARWLASVLALFALAGSVLAQTGRDYIYIVGSSSVYPFGVRKSVLRPKRSATTVA